MVRAGLGRREVSWGLTVADVTANVREAYEAGAESWLAGPEAVYARLAAALIDECPFPLAGARVLDLGAGTGVASDAVQGAGGSPIAVDLASAMLRQRFTERPPGAVGNALALPFRGGAFDAVVAAFCVNHFHAPAVALAECHRVLRPGGALVASSFSAAREHPAKTAVEAVLARHGYARPDWYARFKDRAVAATGTPEALAAAARDAGLIDVEGYEREVEAGLDEPGAMVSWRLSMPQTIAFVEGLAASDREALRGDAMAAVSTIDPPSTITMLVLRARSA